MKDDIIFNVTANQSISAVGWEINYITQFNDRAHSLMIWICLGIFIPIAIIIAAMPPDSDMMSAIIGAFLGGAAILLSSFLVDDITDYLFDSSWARW